MQQGWVTSTDARAIRLAFNLFNGAVPTALNKSEDEWDNLYDWNGNFEYDKSELLDSTPVCIFADYEVGAYFKNAGIIWIELYVTEYSFKKICA